MKKRMNVLRMSIAISILVGLSMFAGCNERDLPMEYDTADVRDSIDSGISDPQSGISLQWQEVRFTLPADWEDKYILIESEERVELFQKASYEIEKGMGYIFSITKSGEWWNYGAGERMIAYTDEGMMYYLMQPTDVTCVTEDEAIVAEHGAMNASVNQILTTIEIDAENIHYNVDQFVIPISSVLPLTEEMLVNYTDNELWIARNEIYARHGRVFQNEYLQSRFDSCSWYQRNESAADISESELSEVERENLKVIIAAEEAIREAYPYPKEYETGTAIKVDLQSSGKQNHVSYQVNNVGEDEFSYVLTIDGTDYDLKEHIYMASPVMDVFYITNLNAPVGDMADEDGLEIAVLDEGPSSDPVTHFFKYNGKLNYVGMIAGFPFKEQNGRGNGFNNYSGVTGTVRGDFLETAYFDGYWWYDSVACKIERIDTGFYDYQYYHPHELYVDLPVYLARDSKETRVIPAGSQIYFLGSDLKEWISVRSKEGITGFIRIKDNRVLNVGLAGEEVFSDLYYFD